MFVRMYVWYAQDLTTYTSEGYGLIFWCIAFLNYWCHNCLFPNLSYSALLEGSSKYQGERVSNFSCYSISLLISVTISFNSLVENSLALILSTVILYFKCYVQCILFSFILLMKVIMVDTHHIHVVDSNHTIGTNYNIHHMWYTEAIYYLLWPTLRTHLSIRTFPYISPSNSSKIILLLVSQLCMLYVGFLTFDFWTVYNLASTIYW